MKYLIIIVAIILVILLVVVIIGYLLPVKHEARKEFAIKASPDSVWRRLRDFKRYPEWRSKLKSVKVKSDTSWVEIDGRGHQLPLMIMDEETAKMLVISINGANLPFGGTWVFTLQGNKNETMVTITENGEVYNPIFRFVSRFITGHNATINQYAHDLEKSF